MSTSGKSKTRAKQKKTAAKPQAISPSREQIAQLAEKFWMESGQPDGSAEQDWLRAESELTNNTSGA